MSMSKTEETRHADAWAARQAEKQAQRDLAAADLSSLTREELARLAGERGVPVVRADGKDGEPLKSDYLSALR